MPKDGEQGGAPVASCGNRAHPVMRGHSGPSVPPRAWLAPFILVCCDIVVLQTTMVCGVLFRLLLNHWRPIGIGPEVFSGAMIAALAIPIGYWIAGLYPGYGLTAVERLRARIVVTCLSFGAMILFDYVAQNGQWSRGILLVAAVLAVVACPLWDALVCRFLQRWRLWGTAVAVFGPPDRRRTVVDALHRHPDIGWIPVAEAEEPDLDAPAISGVSIAILPVSSLDDIRSDLTDHLPYPSVVIVGSADRLQNLWVSVRDVGTHLGLEMRRNLLLTSNRVVKRGCDILLSLVALAVALPVIAVFAALIKIASPGPAFFSQPREGLNGRPFTMRKLRSMRLSATADLPAMLAESSETAMEWRRNMKLRHDPRIIPGIGHFVRRFSIDELPQLWDVLRGDMSLVGPRPLPIYHVLALDPAASLLRRRVRPGITGLSQVSGRSTNPIADQQKLDSYYVRNWSIWLDLHILARTILIVLSGRGAW